MPVCDYVALTAGQSDFMALTRHQLEVMKTVRLCQIYDYLANGTAMPACNISTLMANSGPLMQYTPYQISVLQTILLCDIGTSLGGGAGGGGGATAVHFRKYGNYGANDAIPEDGTIINQGVWNLDTGHAYENVNWPDTASPVWEAH